MPKAVSEGRAHEPMSGEEMLVQHVKENPVNAPDGEFLELTHTGETGTSIGSNKFYRMENNHDGTFTATYGRVGVTSGMWSPRSYTWDIGMWQTKYYEKAQLHGYLLIKSGKNKEGKPAGGKTVVVKGKKYAPIRNRSVREIVERLLSMAKQAIGRNYEVGAAEVSERQVELADASIAKLKKHAREGDMDAFNTELMVLFSAIPRKMDNVSWCKAGARESMDSILAREMDLLDVMRAQVKTEKGTGKEDAEKKADKPARRKSLLTANGLQWRDCTDEEIANIKKHLGPSACRFKKAWRVVSKKQDAAFSRFVEKNGIRKGGIRFLYHGSRNENFWSIITGGLKLRPQGVHITGKMFGYGIYFAPSAGKSMGYTSTHNSRWAHGSSDSGFLAVYKVATGKPYDVHTYANYGNMDYRELQNRCPGAHCLWAHAGSMLRKDEVVVYREDQCTLRYLVEMA